MSIIKLASNIATVHVDEDYYDHVPGSTRTGGAVGTLVGAGSGAAIGYGASKVPKRLKFLATNGGKLGEVLSYVEPVKGQSVARVVKILEKMPGTRKSMAIGSGLGSLIGGIDGSYRGMLTGVGMNDRQYLLERDLDPNEIVKNSMIASMQMNGSGGRLSNISNQAFGRITGGIRRGRMENRKDNTLIERGIDQ